MLSFLSYFRGASSDSKKEDETNTSNNNVIPRSLEINVNAIEDEEELLEITTRKKTYAEVAKDAFVSSNNSASYSIETKQKKHQTDKQKDISLKKSAQPKLEDSVNSLDHVNYDLRKSNRHTLKSKNKRTPSYLKELKSKKTAKKQTSPNLGSKTFKEDPLA